MASNKDQNAFDQVSFLTDATEYLKSIDATTQELLRTSRGLSQSDARNRTNSSTDTSPGAYRNVSRRGLKSRSNFGSKLSGDTSEAVGGFVDEFEKAIFEGLGASDLKKKLGMSMNAFADAIGVDIKDLQGTIGRELGRQAIKAFKGSELGKNLTAKLSSVAGDLFKGAKSGLKSVVSKGLGKDSADKLFSDISASYKSQAAAAASAAKTTPAEESLSTPSGTSSPKEASLSQVSDISDQLDTIIDILLQNSKVGVTDPREQKKAEAEAQKQAEQTETKKQAETAKQSESRLNDEAAKQAEDQNRQFNLDSLGDKAQSKIDDLTAKAKDKVSGLKDKIDPKGQLSGKVGNLKDSLISKSSILKDTALSKAQSSGILNGKLGSVLGKVGGIFGKSAAGAGAGASAGAGGVTAAAGAKAAGSAMSMVAGAASKVAVAFPYVAAAAAAIYVGFKVLKKVMGPAIEGFKKLAAAVKTSANRDKESRKKNLEYEKERLAADVKSMVEAPFEILKDAVNKVTSAWDSNIRTINQTQGYNKSDLQDLMAAFAGRLRSEGLASVIGGDDITSNLSKVLQAGLSGAIAEEFAYQATVLGAAVPTQDFFSYAEEYASIASNAMLQGKSQADAIAEATAQLKQFASNVLYANRELTGGFTTGLKDASSLFKDAVVISQAARTNNSTAISGVLTSVSAIVGAVAPDLVSEIVGSITKAATGGNSSELVALRSLAGINASNTEFLRRFAEDPQGVFSAVFSGLAQRQQMAPDAYMEVAEGLSSVFGISADALARVDFQYLADAISNMSVNNTSLDQNMKLLASGQSTTNAEMHRLAQINEYMVNEGLALVLDNEVARSIQEHMWEEQMKRELMEAEYGVNLHGAALEFLEGIKNTVNNVLAFLNPLGWLFNKIANVVQTAAEAAGQEADIKQILALGSVGNGNLSEFYQLTTRNQNLHLTRSYVSQLGGVSAYETARNVGNLVHALNSTNWGTEGGDLLDAGVSFLKSAAVTGLTAGVKAISGVINGKTSYKWGALSKKQSSMLSSLSSVTPITQLSGATTSKLGSSSAATVSTRFDEFLDTMEAATKAGQNYNEWAATASKFGIADLSEAASKAGYTESQLQDMFSGQSSKSAGEKEQERKKIEDKFWADTIAYEKKWTEEGGWWNTLDGHLTTMEASLLNLELYITDKKSDGIYKSLKDFKSEWMDYFVWHKVYDDQTHASTLQSKLNQIKSDENSEISDAVYTLARNLLGSEFKDPQVQTNALLAQILMVVNAIMQQQNDTSETLSLPNTMAGLAQGIFESFKV